MRVLVVEPLKVPYEKDIRGDLKSMQAIVGGLIEAIYPFEDEELALICNEEAMFAGDVEEMKSVNMMDCIECGSCAYNCPGAVPLVLAFRTGKHYIRQAAAAAKK